MRRIPLTQRAPRMAHATIQRTAAGHRPTPTGKLPQASESWRRCGPLGRWQPPHWLPWAALPERFRASSQSCGAAFPDLACAAQRCDGLNGHHRAGLSAATEERNRHVARCAALYVACFVLGATRVDAAQVLCCSSRGAVAMEMIQSGAWRRLPVRLGCGAHWGSTRAVLWPSKQGATL
jgi:hypothetical protein